MELIQARQGDLLIQRIDCIPPQATPMPGWVLARGEGTGHAHVLDRGQLYMHGGALYFRTDSMVALRHEEHRCIQLPEGSYQVIRQREYTPLAPRSVID